MTLLDLSGDPIVGKECIAFSLVEPAYGIEYGIPFAISNLKYFSFENSVSMPSDINGNCIFENLTIYSATK